MADKFVLYSLLLTFTHGALVLILLLVGLGIGLQPMDTGRPLSQSDQQTVAAINAILRVLTLPVFAIITTRDPMFLCFNSLLWGMGGATTILWFQKRLRIVRTNH